MRIIFPRPAVALSGSFVYGDCTSKTSPRAVECIVLEREREKRTTKDGGPWRNKIKCTAGTTIIGKKKVRLHVEQTMA